MSLLDNNTVVRHGQKVHGTRAGIFLADFPEMVRGF